MSDNRDLLAFVSARLDEEQQIAERAGAGSWRCPPDLPGEVHEAIGAVAFSPRNQGFDHHIAYQNPAQTLRRIETARILLSEYAEVAALDTDRPTHDFPSGRAVGLGFVVRQMAAEHAGHPGFKAAWLPRFTR
ncbi:DUF6221 family protein [Streptomyces sp. NPDC088725]|uniref:DUF6221 family protein n=1 Tax=Streptomyces sp. NPDC088725 TaxID=3365873 RepID=UPI003818F691